MKVIYLICFIPLLLSGCKKRQDAPPATTPFNYSVFYNSVFTLHANSTGNFVFTIKVISGDISTNHLSCYVTGLPANVTISPDTLDVAQLLGGVFTFTTTNIAVGSYPVQLVIYTKARGAETYNLTLKVDAPADFAPLLAGTYDTSFDYCMPVNAFYGYSSVVSTVADTPYLLKMTNIKNLGSTFVVRAWISNVVTIPVQTIGGQTIWGSGTYIHDARAHHENDYMMTINDTLVTGVDTESCIIHMQHKY
jgi:hypothetical protein